MKGKLRGKKVIQAVWDHWCFPDRYITLDTFVQRKVCSDMPGWVRRHVSYDYYKQQCSLSPLDSEGISIEEVEVREVTQASRDLDIEMVAQSAEHIAVRGLLQSAPDLTAHSWAVGIGLGFQNLLDKFRALRIEPLEREICHWLLMTPSDPS